MSTTWPGLACGIAIAGLFSSGVERTPAVGPSWVGASHPLALLWLPAWGVVAVRAFRLVPPDPWRIGLLPPRFDRQAAVVHDDAGLLLRGVPVALPLVIPCLGVCEGFGLLSRPTAQLMNDGVR
jgi:hypothetical protein